MSSRSSTDKVNAESVRPGEPIIMSSLFHRASLAGTSFTLACCVILVYLLFSTRASRCTWLFWLHCFSFTLVIAFSVVQLRLIDHRIKLYYVADDQQEKVRYAQLDLAFELLVIATPLVADGTLFCKIAVLYPLRQNRTSWIILSTYLVLLAVRLADVLLFIFFAVNVQQGSHPFALGQVNYFVPLVIDCGAQLVTCAFAAFLFLHRCITKNSGHNGLGMILEAAFMSFVPPVLIQLASFAVVTVRSESTSITAISAPLSDLLVADTLTNCKVSNVLVSMLFALLATSWSTIRGPPSSPPPSSPSLPLSQGPPSASILSISHEAQERQRTQEDHGDTILIRSILRPETRDQNFEDEEEEAQEVILSVPRIHEQHDEEDKQRTSRWM